MRNANSLGCFSEKVAYYNKLKTLNIRLKPDINSTAYHGWTDPIKAIRFFLKAWSRMASLAATTLKSFAQLENAVNLIEISINQLFIVFTQKKSLKTFLNV